MLDHSRLQNEFRSTSRPCERDRLRMESFEERTRTTVVCLLEADGSIPPPCSAAAVLRWQIAEIRIDIFRLKWETDLCTHEQMDLAISNPFYPSSRLFHFTRVPSLPPPFVCSPTSLEAGNKTAAHSFARSLARSRLVGNSSPFVPQPPKGNQRGRERERERAIDPSAKHSAKS